MALNRAHTSERPLIA